MWYLEEIVNRNSGDGLRTFGEQKKEEKKEPEKEVPKRTCGNETKPKIREMFKKY